MSPWHYWVIAGIVLMILEIFTPGFLLASFGVGAFAAGAAAFMGNGLKLQLALFGIGTLVTFFGIRPLYLRKFAKYDDPRKTGVDALIGQGGVVVEAIDNHSGAGRIRVGSELWRAQLSDGATIEADSRVIVDRVEGATVYVSHERKGE